MSNNSVINTSTPPSSDVNFSMVRSLLHFNGSVGSAAITDTIGNVINNANTTITDVWAKNSTTSGNFNSSRIDSTGKTADQYKIGTQDFAVEFSMKLANYTDGQIVFDQRGYHLAGNYLTLYISGGTLQVYLQEVQRIATPTLSAGPHDVAVTRIAGVLRLFVDGIQVGGNYADSTDLQSNYWCIGANGWQGGSQNNMLGQFDEFRYTIGNGRYSSNYTVAVDQFPDQ